MQSLIIFEIHFLLNDVLRELGQVCDFNLLQIMRLNDGTDR